MIRSLPALRFSPRAAKKAAQRRMFLGLRGLIALFIAVLQLASALHFTLVPHTFSAALGGVVHVHGSSESQLARQALAHGPRAHAQAFAADAPSCVVDLCPFADAPHNSLPCVAAVVSGAAAFGAAGLLSEAEARSPSARRVFLSAPKTSPPV
jgi:hypothetical protein